MILLWLTRGRTWGFRFLIRGEQDPLPIYDSIFSTVGDVSEAWLRVDNRIALRIIDPAGRKDAAGRPISHDFVLAGEMARRVRSVSDGVSMVWPLVEGEYAKKYEADLSRSAGD